MLRVVSLLPSATEILACIVAKQPVGRKGEIKLVGRSHECDFPKGFADDVPILTSPKTVYDDTSDNPARKIDEQVKEAMAAGNSLYTLDIEQLQSLSPDVILTQSLCKVCSIDLMTVERIVKRMKIPSIVVDLNPHSLQELLDDIHRVGKEIGCEEGSKKVVEELELRRRRVIDRTKTFTKRPNIAFMEWTDPIYPGGHWTPELIELAGGLHPLNQVGVPSVAITDETFLQSQPDLMIIAPCGLKMAKTEELIEIIRKDEKRAKWFNSLKAVQQNKVVLVDGNEMFNRPGPRLVDALEFCSALVESFQTTEESLSMLKTLQGKTFPSDFPWQYL